VAGAAAAGVIYFTVLQQNLLTALIALPVIVLPFLAYRTYFRRIESKTHEAIEASRLYMSAIEALSNAIEAREQLTPGHVRRVQIYSVELGKVLNLPPTEIKALELASLLHGIGKLAVPDYILNKPGTLSVSERERVKLHPLVGAEIVNSVAFPYPVTEAVKYYHEAWDGYGYPEGLRGEEIPLTARILGLTDAYDTMREERPYRAAQTRDDARRMLLAGAGTRFDPKLVDIFLRYLVQFEEKIVAAGLPLDGATEIITESGARQSLIPHYLQQIRQTNREVFALYELARLSSASLSMRELLPFLCNKVQELVSCDTCVIYLYDKLHETARAAHTSGKNAAFLSDREINIGEGVIGFALKNNKTITSISPSLDFTGDYTVIAHEYKTMAVLPLQTGDRLIGALAVYSEKLAGYDEEHLRLLEATSHVAADAIARTIQHAENENRALTDSLTGLPNARSLQLQFEKEVSRSKRTGRTFQFIMFDLDDFKVVNDTFGHRVGDIMLCEVAQILRGQLRDYDFLARYGGDEFIAIVPELNQESVEELCQRIEQTVLGFELPVDGERFARVGISVGAATYPEHGETLDQIMVAADQCMYSVKAVHKSASGKLVQPNSEEIDFIIQSVN
jgi:diguanylate cyclase (GGDEF)-like protein